jgi:hypothetical protein
MEISSYMVRLKISRKGSYRGRKSSSTGANKKTKIKGRFR